MKNIFSIIALSVLGFTQAQVIIGGTNGTATNKTAVLLEFEAGQNKGIILPYVRTLPVAGTVTPGTILLDASNPTGAKIKLYAPGNALADSSDWVDLSSGNNANVTTALSQQPLSINVTEVAAAKAIIGSNSTTANGVLVLESTTKAMMLPQVATTDDVKDPAPGMMVYVTGAKKRLAVFNGAKWTYWAPTP